MNRTDIANVLAAAILGPLVASIALLLLNALGLL